MFRHKYFKRVVFSTGILLKADKEINIQEMDSLSIITKNNNKTVVRCFSNVGSSLRCSIFFLAQLTIQRQSEYYNYDTCTGSYV